MFRNVRLPAVCLKFISMTTDQSVWLSMVALIKCCVMIIVIGEAESEKYTVQFYGVFNGFRFLPAAI